MKIEDKYSTVEQSRRLKELGIVQGKSERYWYVGDTGTNTDHLNITGSNYKGDDMCYSAFDVAELGNMLPYQALGDSVSELFEGFEKMNLRRIYGYGIWPFKNIWRFRTPIMSNDDQDEPMIYGTEAQVRAALLIHLLENNIITPEEINNRLTTTP